jgi:hypothetical protein
MFMVYDTSKHEIHIVSSKELVKSEYDEYCLVRDLSLSSDPVLMKDFDDTLMKGEAE